MLCWNPRYGSATSSAQGGAPAGESLSGGFEDTRAQSLFAAVCPRRAHGDGLLKSAVEGLWYGEGAVV